MKSCVTDIYKELHAIYGRIIKKII